MSKRDLFMRLLAAGTEDQVQGILDSEGLTTDPTKWTPYGDNESFYGVVENQQAHPVPALVEKITNGIDAILEKKVIQAGLDIRSPEAPRSVREALDRYFPDHRNWDLGDARRHQARELQIVASGPRRDTSLLVYDDGVGQAPEDFPGTFLSLLRGNKNDVHFVQGKYNMGGAGAIAFCGDRRFQLVASKRFDGAHPSASLSCAAIRPNSRKRPTARTPGMSISCSTDLCRPSKSTSSTSAWRDARSAPARC